LPCATPSTCGGVAFELRTAAGERLPVLVTSAVKHDTEGRAHLIRTTVFDARDRRDYERELLRARQAADRDRERLQLLVAGLQRSLLPTVLPAPPGMRTAAHYHMASPDEVGGDFYDLFRLPDGRWAFFLGDVCGKGVRAAAVTARARYTLRAAAVYDPSPAVVLGNLNTVLCQDADSGDGDYCTVVFGVLTPTATGYRADLAGGGHPSGAAAARRRHRRVPAHHRRHPHRSAAAGPDRHPCRRPRSGRHAAAVHRRHHRGEDADRPVRRGGAADVRRGTRRRRCRRCRRRAH
jgi:hypothetical protein